MVKNPCVLLLSTSIGAGHAKAANSVDFALREMCEGIQTRVLDVFQLSSPYLGKFITKAYINVVKQVPQVYGYMYRFGNRSLLARGIREWVSRRLAKKLKKYIQDIAPDAIVCTHASPAGAVAVLKRKGYLTTPVVAVITDFIIHRLWVYPEIDCYIVAHEGMRQALVQEGIPHERIVISGIPISPQFTKPSASREILRQQLSLDPKRPVILIMGGGAGVLPMKDIVNEIRDLDQAQMVIITGHNTALFERLQASKNDNIRVLGYVDNVCDYMSAADVLVSKPGGLTSSEALCKGLPMIIFRPIPGVEEGNTAYLLDAGCAIRVDHVQDLRIELAKLLDDRGTMDVMRQRALAICTKQAAHEASKTVLLKITGSMA